MKWSDVGDWIKTNAGNGAELVGSLLTGNVVGAVSAGVAMVSSATGTADPEKALQALKTDPATLIRLKEIAAADDANIREHIRAMHELDLKDQQAQHHETQETIREGDAAEDPFVRRTRPGQSWLSLAAAIVYVFCSFGNGKTPDENTLMLLLTLPWAYAGLREVGKGLNVFASRGQQAPQK